MKANTDKTQSGTELYTHRIKELADEYIDTLDDPEQIYNPQTAYFNGMIKYIYSFSSDRFWNADISACKM